MSEGHRPFDDSMAEAILDEVLRPMPNIGWSEPEYAPLTGEDLVNKAIGRLLAAARSIRAYQAQQGERDQLDDELFAAVDDYEAAMGVWMAEAGGDEGEETPEDATR